MKKQASSRIHSTSIGLVGFGLLIAIALGAVFLTRTIPGGGLGSLYAAQSTAVPAQPGDALTTLQPPATCGDSCARNLVGKTAEEIGNYAVEYASQGLMASGEPELLTVRSITPQQFQDLGLGCPFNVGSIEKPPLALTVLKGRFSKGTFPGMTFPMRSLQDPIPTRYLVLVFDLWAGQPMQWLISDTDSELAAVLYGAAATPTSNCVRTSPSESTFHYGSHLPGIPSTPAPAPPTADPSQATTLPEPERTAEVPISK